MPFRFVLAFSSLEKTNWDFLLSTAHPKLLALSFPSSLCPPGPEGNQHRGFGSEYGSAVWSLHPCMEDGPIGPVFRNQPSRVLSYICNIGN